MKKKINRNASPSAYGWCFQVGAGMSLFLDNIKDISSVKMEGLSDDIEIVTNNGKKIYAQAKSVVQIGDQRSANQVLKKALDVLKEDDKNNDALKLIYITNISNPLSSNLASAYNFGMNYEFSILPENDQKKIVDITGQDFNKNKFQLQILYFFGEGENKFVKIKEKIESFLRNAINDISYSKQVLDSWFETFMLNCSDKPDQQKKLNLNKKQIIYPIIAIVLYEAVTENEFGKVCNNDNYFEVMKDYRKIINDNLCDYEFIVEIIGDYFEKRNKNPSIKLTRYDYTIKYWKEFEKKFLEIKHDDKRESLVKLLVLSIISHCTLINDIKEASNLCN